MVITHTKPPRGWQGTESGSEETVRMSQGASARPLSAKAVAV